MAERGKNQPKLPMPSTQRSVPIAMLRARERLMVPIRKMLAETGLTEQQWRVLRVLEEYGPLDASRLADRAGLLLPSQTRLVQTLTEKDLVARIANPNDRRKQTIVITQKGYDLVAANVSQNREINAAVENAIGRERLGTLFSILDDIQKL